MSKIRLNFIALENQEQDFVVYRKRHVGPNFDEQSFYYDLDEGQERHKYEIRFEVTKGFEDYRPIFTVTITSSQKKSTTIFC